MRTIKNIAYKAIQLRETLVKRLSYQGITASILDEVVGDDKAEDLPGGYSNALRRLSEEVNVIKLLNSARIVLWKQEIAQNLRKASYQFETYSFCPPTIYDPPHMNYYFDETGEFYITDVISRPDGSLLHLVADLIIDVMVQDVSQVIQFVFLFDAKLNEVYWTITVRMTRDRYLTSAMVHNWFLTQKQAESGTTVNAAALILAMSTFMESKIIDQQQVRLPRGARRRRKRAGVTEPDPMIKYITLRRRTPAEHQKAQDQSSSMVDWSHRWVVEPHLRHQWYPSEQVHKPIWIDSYIKGPPDKPLKLDKETVIKVCR